MPGSWAASPVAASTNTRSGPLRTKATYTGLLKLFLEQLAAGELHGTAAIALMLGAGPQHALAGEHTLKPVFSEIGCSCPTPALFLLDSAWESDPELDAWLTRAHEVLGQI